MMQARMRQASLVAVGLVIALAGTAFAQNDPSLGKWKLNLAKSKYDPGPAPKSETRVYEAWENDGVKVTLNRVEADGKSVTFGYSAHYDGKDYEYTGSPAYDTIALKRVDATTTESTLKKGGKVVLTQKGVASADGKTRTVTTVTGANHNVAVFDKQ